MSDEQELKPINAQLHDDLWESYVSKTGLKEDIDENQAFYNGDQWPAHSPDNFPRPVLNIISYAMNLKASKINGTPLWFAISASDYKTSCSKLRDFDDYMRSKLSAKSFDFQSILNGFINGTEIVYYRWDEDNETLMGIYKGGLAEEHIDPRCFAVANPHLEDIQKQKWVMMWNDYEVGAVKDMLKGEQFSKDTLAKKEKLIDREGAGSHYDAIKDDQNLINHGLVRVYTRFFRKNGEVFYDCSTTDVEIFNTPHALSTLVQKSVMVKAKKDFDDAVKNNEVDESNSLIRDLPIDYEDVTIGNSPSTLNDSDSHRKSVERFNLYPFAVFRPYNIVNSFFGRSDVKSMIPGQKATNFCYAMVIQCAQNNAFNKIFVKEGALKGQKINNEPGQTITDYSQYVNGWGIKMAESQPMPNDLINFVGELFNFQSKIGGFSDVMSGNVSNQDISGYAVQQMIKQANTPIEQQQQIFWKFQVDCFYIRLLFYKFYIDQANYTFEYTDGEMEQQENARKKLLMGANSGLINEITGKPFTMDEKRYLMQPTRKVQMRELTKDEIYGVDFDIRVDAEQGLADSKLTETQFWDNMVLNGGIKNLSPDMLDLVIKEYPGIAPQSKAEMIRYIDSLKQGEMAQMMSQLQQYQTQIQQLADYAKTLEAKLGVSSDYISNLTKEFTNKINTANKIVDYQSKQIQSLTGKASEGEGKSNNARGIGGTDIAPEVSAVQ
jgi:hypothetical protein